MDGSQFDAIVQSVATSRRSLIASVAAVSGFLVLPSADARKKRRKRKRRKETCESNCAGRCGMWTDTCGEPVTCAACDAGQQCLSNGSCAVACLTNEDCGTCGCSNPSIEGERHCVAGLLQPFVSCTSTADCPPGNHCQDIGFGGVCIELCD